MFPNIVLLTLHLHLNNQIINQADIIFCVLIPLPRIEF